MLRPIANAIPVARSILSAEALAPLLEEAYALADVHCRLIKALIADTYEVTSRRGRFILRVYGHGQRTEEEIEGELGFLEHLVAQGLFVSAPVEARGGLRLLALVAPEGVRHAVLFTCVPGSALESHLNPSTARIFGSTIAKLHLAADGYAPSIRRPALELAALVERPLAALAQVLSHRVEIVGAFGRVAARISERISALPLRPPEFGYCHGDAVPANAHLDDDRRIALFDFEQCGPTWRAYDVAVCLLDLRTGSGDEEVQAFLDGYQARRRLSPEELDALPALQAARLLWVLGQFAANNDRLLGTYRLRDEVVDTALARLEDLLRA